MKNKFENQHKKDSSNEVNLYNEILHLIEIGNTIRAKALIKRYEKRYGKFLIP